MEGRSSLREFAEKLALEEVQQHFSEPAHLDTLSKVREQYERKLITVETQLEAGQEAQLDEMQNAQVLLNMAKEEMGNVQKAFKAIREQSLQCTSAIDNFDHVLQIRNARSNITEILQQLDIYDAVPRRVMELKQLLVEDDLNLRTVFSEWIQLNTWRERILADVVEAMYEAGRKEEMMNERLANWEELDPSTVVESSWGQSSEAHSQILRVLGDHFQKVEDLGEGIWKCVAERLRNYFDLAQYEDTAKLVAAVEVVERVDLHDNKERKRRMAMGESPEKLEMLIPPYKWRTMALQELEHAMERHLQVFLPKTLEPEPNSSSKTAPESNSDDSDTDDEQPVQRAQTAAKSKIGPFINAANALIVNMRTIAEDVAKCFPECYNILGLYRWVVERRLIGLLRPVWRGSFASSGDKLQLIAWIDVYVQTVDSVQSSGFGGGDGTVSGATNTFIAIDGVSAEEARAAASTRLRELKRECDSMMSGYITEALPRMNKYVNAILSRDNTPQATMTGSLRTAIPEDLFHALSQELAVVASHGVRGKQMAAFMQRGVLETLKEYQALQSARVTDSSVSTSIEWCCAFMNDYERMYDLCDSELATEFKQGIGEEDGPNADALLADTQDALDKVAAGFLRGVKEGTNRIVDEMFAVLESSNVVAHLFTPAWEKGTVKPIATMRVTFEDYFDDQQFGLRTWLGSEMLFGRLVAKVLERILEIYVACFMARVTPFGDRTAAVLRIRSDAMEIHKCFSKYLDVLQFGKIRSLEVFSERLAILRRMANVLDDAMPQNHFEDIAQEFGPFAQQAITRLLFYRGDLSHEERSDLQLYDVSDHVAAGGVARFNLSELPPIPQGDDSPSTPPIPETEETAKAKAKTKKQMKRALAKIKKSKKSELEAGPTVEMSLNDFVGRS